ncbi:MAG TPA: hypothetical protein VEL31_11935 [Ktedonobacteraceae bacterium]|nr:hypothetical protein [Ktedonobacteraceae bacterium]
MLDKDHYINLKNGIFDTTKKADLDHLFTTFSTAPERDKLAVFFHGGLTDMQSGMTSAERIMERYKDIGTYQVFFIWETGLLEVLSTNLSQIYNEPVFQQLLMRVTQFAHAKVIQSAAASKARGPDLELPDEVDIWNELHQPANGSVPFASVNPHAMPQNERLQDDEKAQFLKVQSNDNVLQQESQAISSSLMSPDVIRAQEAAKGTQVRASTHTLMSPAVLNPIPETSPLLVLIEQSLQVLTRVIDRFSQRRDHGLYATVVEEILRQFYLANIGKGIWDDMKQETIDAFGDDPDQYGGTAFLQGLKAYCESGQRPHITLVGHSAGSIYICQLLQRADTYLPQDVTFDIVLLAPACTFKLFSDTLAKCAQRIGSVRLFGMSDPVELADVLVLLVYPHSLLYLVSGIFEDETDTPLLGMQRYYTGEAPYNVQDVLSSFAYFNVPQLQRIVWSLASGGDGLSSGVTKHGNFYSDDVTLKSLEYILDKGLQHSG